MFVCVNPNVPTLRVSFQTLLVWATFRKSYLTTVTNAKIREVGCMLGTIQHTDSLQLGVTHKILHWIYLSNRTITKLKHKLLNNKSFYYTYRRQEH